MEEKSISDMKAKLVAAWRDESYQAFLTRIEELCADDKDAEFRRRHVRALFAAKPGDEWYDINQDKMVKLVE